ncbi:MAG: hypothetical protein AAF602_12000 [Myxococcota bacterium]
MKMMLWWLAACSAKPGAPAAPDTPVPGPAPVAEPAPAPAPTPTPVAADPAALYAECRDRVESPQSSGECEADGDCQTSGCSNELCIAKSAGQMMSACDMRPCFEVLEACGCHDGQCTWTVADAAPSSP